jgi:hypothetical protein
MQVYIEAKDAFDWLGVLTTFVSVILGAVLAYTATRVSERRKERSEQIAKATLLSLKFRNVVDGVFRLDRQLSEGMQKAAAAGVKGPPWTQFEQISSIADYEEVITVEDMSVLAERGHYELIEGITELRDGHNSSVKALAQVYQLRDRLADVMPPNQIEGDVASFEGTPSAEALLIIVNLNTLSANILRNLAELKEQARQVAPEVHEKLKASLKVKQFPLVTIPADLPPAPSAGSGPEASIQKQDAALSAG